LVVDLSGQLASDQLPATAQAARVPGAVLDVDGRRRAA